MLCLFTISAFHRHQKYVRKRVIQLTISFSSNFTGARSFPGNLLVLKMNKIEDIKIGPMPESNFLKPLHMTFTQNGRARFWDFVKLHESVSAIIFNRKRNVLIFVKQFRPAVYFASAQQRTGDNRLQNDIDWSKVPPENGITIELCAGIVDEKLPLKEIMKKEVLEECGYDVPLANFEQVISHRSGVGVSGDKNTLFYAEVTDEMKVNEGGGLASEGELIEVVEMTLPEVRKFIEQDAVQSPGGLLFGIMWFLNKKAPKDC